MEPTLVPKARIFEDWREKRLALADHGMSGAREIPARKVTHCGALECPNWRRASDPWYSDYCAAGKNFDEEAVKTFGKGFPVWCPLKEAQVGEAGTAETHSGSVYEHAVPKGCAMINGPSHAPNAS